MKGNGMDYRAESLKLHYQWKGKIEVIATTSVNNKEDLSLAYTPGVAEPCLEIQKDVNKSYELTRRWNMAAVITDGTAGQVVNDKEATENAYNAAGQRIVRTVVDWVNADGDDVFDAGELQNGTTSKYYYTGNEITLVNTETYLHQK